MAGGNKPTNRFAKESDINEILAMLLKTNPKADKLARYTEYKQRLFDYYDLLIQHGADENLKNNLDKTPKELKQALKE